jgi:hypothetical protein
LLHIDYAIRVTYESPCGVVDSHTTSRRFRDVRRRPPPPLSVRFLL